MYIYLTLIIVLEIPGRSSITNSLEPSVDVATIETSICERSRNEEGKRKINNYVIIRELGRGGFGKVKLGYMKEKNKYFVKILINLTV
jgi:hypothetical protein